MKNIDINRLERIEEFVKKNALEIHIRKLSGVNYDPECEVDVSDEVLEQIFGEMYKSCPEKFCFRDGDRMFIHELVKHVKKIFDEKGPNSGLQKFKIKARKPRHRFRPHLPMKFENDMKIDQLPEERVSGNQPLQTGNQK